MGLYLTEDILPFDKVFRSVSCEDGYYYSLLAYDLVRIDELNIPYPVDPLVAQWDEDVIKIRVLFQIYYLRNLYEGMSHDNESVREKYCEAWRKYKTRHPKLTKILSDTNFNPCGLCDIDWENAQKAYEDNVRFFKV